MHQCLGVFEGWRTFRSYRQLIFGLRTVVVTGAYGFVGAHTARYFLQCGYAVRIIVRSQSKPDGFNSIADLYQNQQDNRLSVCTIDINNSDELTEAFASTDAVVHCAALVSFDQNSRDLLFETNVEGTASVVNACIAAGVKNLVHISSVAALGRKEGTNNLTEDSEWVESTANTDYAVSKHLAENEVYRGMEEGLNVALICPGVVLGPWKGKGSSGIIYERAKQGRPFYPTGTTGFVGVRDVAVMAETMIQHRVWGKRFIAVAENVAYKTLLDDLAARLNAKKPRIPLNNLIVKPVFYLCKALESIGIKPPFPSQALKSTHSISIYTPQNTALLPGFKFTPLSEVHDESVRFLK